MTVLNRLCDFIESAQKTACQHNRETALASPKPKHKAQVVYSGLSLNQFD